MFLIMNYSSVLANNVLLVLRPCNFCYPNKFSNLKLQEFSKYLKIYPFYRHLKLENLNSKMRSLSYE